MVKNKRNATRRLIVATCDFRIPLWHNWHGIDLLRHIIVTVQYFSEVLSFYKIACRSHPWHLSTYLKSRNQVLFPNFCAFTTSEYMFTKFLPCFHIQICYTMLHFQNADKIGTLWLVIINKPHTPNPFNTLNIFFSKNKSLLTIYSKTFKRDKVLFKTVKKCELNARHDLRDYKIFFRSVDLDTISWNGGAR